MKPGIPWSVKGIEQQARVAAKQAARQSGMTIGEWLNSVIMESADGNDDLERRYRRPPYRPRQAHGAEQGDGEEVTLRLEEIADQLHDMARHDSDTALARPMGPEDETQLRAIIERLDAHEHNTSSALGAMQEQLEQVSQRLGGEAGQPPTAPQRPDDVPGYRALEGALRNIIEHIEISETRTRDSIRSLQERLTQPSGELNDLSEVQQAEQRLRGLVEEARHAGGALDPSEGLAQLRLEMEQLAATVSQGSGHALADLAGHLEQLEADAQPPLQRARRGGEKRGRRAQRAYRRDREAARTSGHHRGVGGATRPQPRGGPQRSRRQGGWAVAGAQGAAGGPERRSRQFRNLRPADPGDAAGGSRDARADRRQAGRTRGRGRARRQDDGRRVHSGPGRGPGRGAEAEELAAEPAEELEEPRGVGCGGNFTRARIRSPGGSG
jgi:hypothetical protein